jgi:hypothetical protein
MGKRILSLYVDDDLVNLARSKMINMSRLVNRLLETELTYKELSDTTTKEELIDKLKVRCSLLSDEIKLLTDKNKEQETIIKKLKEKKVDNKPHYRVIAEE